MPLYFGKKIVGDTAHTVEYVGAKVLEDEVIINPTREDSGNPDTVQYDIYTEPFLDDNGEEFDAINNIKVRKVGSWIDSEISADNIRKGKSILGVAGNIIELVPEKISLKSSSTQKIVTPSQGNGFTEITVEPYILEQKTISPSKYNVNVYPSSGYDALSRVTVNAVTSDVDSNIKPENIKKDVNILGVTGTLEEIIESDPILESLVVNPTTSSQTITPNEGVDGFNKVSVNPVTSSIDANITPRNIKRGVNILGVEGNYVIENLQDKVANPTTSTQVITFDDGYEGLGNVTITPVTSTIDTNIVAENIREGVTILGVTGTLEDDVVEIEPTRTVTPQTNAQIITPNEGYDALSQVNIEGVTASIDPNILAENIKKNIEILGVKGTLESQSYNLQDSKEVEPSTMDMEITPDTTYDALLKVIVKAVTASIDPNILPKNIKKNISILGVVGTLEEGEAQKWFDFEGLQGYTPLSKIPHGTGGNDSINMTLTTNNYVAEEFINKNFDNVSNISAALFNIVTGYDDVDVTYNVLEQPFVAFIGGKYYSDYSSMVTIEDQIRYLYPLENELGVNGCTINYKDDGSATTLNAYVITDSTGVNKPTPVLVNGNLSLNMLPEGFDSIRYVSEMNVPEHTVFTPKCDSNLQVHWVKDEGVNYVCNHNEDKPLTVDVSAWDTNIGEDEELTSHNVYDYTITGSLSINEDNIVSGFTTNNLFQLNPKISFKQNEKFELQMKVTTGSNLNDYQEIFTITTQPLLLRIYNGRWQMPYYIGSWQSSTKDSVSANTTYYTIVKYFPSQTTQDGYTYTARYMYLEIYDENKSLLHRYSYNLSSTFLQFNNSSAFIGSQGGAECWSGSIHLNECYIKINDLLIWDAQPLSSIVTTNHNINPITKDLMFYNKINDTVGNLINYEDNGSAINMPLYWVETVSNNNDNFEQPILSSYNDWGGSSFAIRADNDTSGNNPAWYAMDNSTSTYWRGGNVPGYIEFYNPEPIIVTNIRWGYFYSYPTSGNIQGSDNGSTWENIIDWTNNSSSDFDIDLSSNTKAYKYYRINISSVNRDVIHCNNLTITGKYSSNSNIYIFSPDDSFVDGENYTNAKLVDTINIPEHNTNFIYNDETGAFEKSIDITINVDDDNTTIYTEIGE